MKFKYFSDKLFILKHQTWNEYHKFIALLKFHCNCVFMSSLHHNWVTKSTTIDRRLEHIVSRKIKVQPFLCTQEHQQQNWELIGKKIHIDFTSFHIAQMKSHQNIEPTFGFRVFGLWLFEDMLLLGIWLHPNVDIFFIILCLALSPVEHEQ